MKSKDGYEEWSNGKIKLYYLDDDKPDFLAAAIVNDIYVMVDYSVAECDMESGLMRRTQYGREVFKNHIRSTIDLKARIKERNR